MAGGCQPDERLVGDVKTDLYPHPAGRWVGERK